MPRSLWMGDLEPHMNENYITRLFQDISQPASVKLIKRKEDGLPEKYCFIEFATESEAERVLKKLNGTVIPGSDPVMRYRLNRTQNSKASDVGPSFSLFVGDLDPTVTDDQLEDFFLKKFPNLAGAKIMYEKRGASRGYGFVRFKTEAEQKRAALEMQGARGLGGKPIKIRLATDKGKMNSTTDNTSVVDTAAYNQQWLMQYNQYYQQQQQYYNMYNANAQYSYYQQQQMANSVATSNNVETTQLNSAYQSSTNPKLEDPNPFIDIDGENEIYFLDHIMLLNGLGCHWQPSERLSSQDIAT